MLPDKRRVGGSWDPPPPLILAAWHEASDRQKMHVFHGHLRYAYMCGVHEEVAKYLDSLDETQWYHR